MNPRTTTAIAGVIILAMGLAGLLYPDRVIGVLGFGKSQAPATLGEIRATYGGLFVVMGVYTLLSAMDPSAHRGRILFVGLLWLGACAGRLVGAATDGNPGLPGWLSLAFEVVVGGALVLAWFRTPISHARTEPQLAAAPPAAPTPPPNL